MSLAMHVWVGYLYNELTKFKQDHSFEAVLTLIHNTKFITINFCFSILLTYHILFEIALYSMVRIHKDIHESFFQLL